MSSLRSNDTPVGLNDSAPISKGSTAYPFTHFDIRAGTTTTLRSGDTVGNASATVNITTTQNATAEMVDLTSKASLDDKTEDIETGIDANETTVDAMEVSDGPSTSGNADVAFDQGCTDLSTSSVVEALRYHNARRRFPGQAPSHMSSTTSTAFTPRSSARSTWSGRDIDNPSPLAMRLRQFRERRRRQAAEPEAAIESRHD